MNILVTGSCGFIGAHACQRFLTLGYQVVGLDNLSRPGGSLNLSRLQSKSGFSYFHGDIRFGLDISRVFQRYGPFDVVLHAAGQVAVTTSVSDPVTDFHINALGTLNILEGVRKFSPNAVVLYTSTNKVYGELPELPISEEPSRYSYASINGVAESQSLDFHSPYGCSKGAADQYVRDYARIYGMKTVVFRQSCIYGTHQFGIEDQGWVAWFAIAAVLGKQVTIYGNGKQVRDILWADDLIDLYIAAIHKSDIAAGKIYNAGGGAGFSLSLLELVTMLNSRGYEVSPHYADWRPGDQRIFVADCSLAKTDLGWQPKTSPSTGVVHLLSWAQLEEETIRSVLNLPRRGL